MTRTTGLTLALATLLSLAAAPAQFAERGAAVAPATRLSQESASAEQRFALRFCFSQYKSQYDATACLARYVR